MRDAECERYRLALRDIEDIAHRVANGSLNTPGREAPTGELKYAMRSLRDKARRALRLGEVEES